MSLFSKNTIIPGKTKPEWDVHKKQCQDYFQESNSALKDRREKWKRHYNYWCNTKLSETRPKYKSTTRVNYCWITTQVKVPIIMASNPTINYIPYVKEPDNEENARKLSKIVGQYLYNKLKMRKKIINVILDSEIYDAGFLKIGFDKNRDELFVTLLDPFKLFPDPFATEFDNSRYVGHAEIYPVNSLQKRFGKFKEQIKADPSISEIIYEERKWHDRQPRVIIASDDMKIGTERAFLKEWWVSPNECDLDVKTEKNESEFKNGMLVTMINDELVVDVKPYPYKHGKPPYVKFISNSIPNEFWAMGDIEQIIPLQDTLNHRIQQLEDIANKCANLGFTVDPKVGRKAIENLVKNGLKIGLLKVLPPGMLKQDDMPQVPQFLFEEVKQIIILIERVTGIQDVMQGRGDVRQRTARGIERLYEAGISRIELSVKLFEESYKEVAYQMGSLVQQYYKEARRINIAGGTDTISESFEITPEKLQEEVEVSIDSAAALPQDKKSRAELGFTLLQNHIFELAMSDDPKMKMIAKIMLDLVEFPNREALLHFQPQNLLSKYPDMALNMQGNAQMPQFAGMPAMNAPLQELASAANMPPEEMARLIEQGISRPTS